MESGNPQQPHNLSEDDKRKPKSAEEKEHARLHLLQSVRSQMELEKKKFEQFIHFCKRSYHGQKEVAGKLSARLHLGIQTCTFLSKYFSEKATMMQTYAKSLENISKIHGIGEVGSTEMALDYVQRVSKVEAENYTACANSYLNQTCKQLSIYATDLSSLYKKVTGTIHDMNSKTEDLIEKSVASFQAYEKSLKETHDFVTVSEDVVHDPWLEYIKYLDSLKAISLYQKEYNKQLLEINGIVDRMDKKRMEGLKGVLKEAVNIQREMLNKISKDVAIASSAVDAIRSESDFTLYLQSAALVSLETKTVEENLPVPVNFVEDSTNENPFSWNSILKASFVVRSGEIELSGLMRWKKYLFVLSITGFLHYFSIEKPTIPETSIPLQYCTLSITEPQKATFQLTWTPTGFFSSTKSYIFRFSKESEMVDWVIDFKNQIYNCRITQWINTILFGNYRLGFQIPNFANIEVEYSRTANNDGVYDFEFGLLKNGFTSSQYPFQYPPWTQSIQHFSCVLGKIEFLKE